MSMLPASAGGILQVFRGISAVDLVLLLAISSNCVLILAPMQPSIRAAHDDLGPKAMGKELASMLLPTFTLFAQCFFWACYGYFIAQSDIARFNAFGAALCLVYLSCLAHRSKPRRQSQPVLVFGVVAVLAFSLMVLSLPTPVMDRAAVFAYAAMFCSLLQSLAPVCQAVEVFLAMKDAALPAVVAFASFVSSALWAQYAMMVHDRLYFLSNALNAMVGAVGLVAIGSAFLSRLSEGSAAGKLLDSDEQPLMPRTARQANKPEACQMADGGRDYGIAKHNLPGNAEERMTLLRPFVLKDGPSLHCEAWDIRAGLPSAFSVFQVKDAGRVDARENELEAEWEVCYFQPALDCVL